MSRNSYIYIIAAVTLIIAFILSPFSSDKPDGLEKAMEDLDTAAEPAVILENSAPMEDYAMPGVKNEFLATGLAGIAGCLAVFAAAWLAGRMLVRRKPEADA